jgi:hypothetical protein
VHRRFAEAPSSLVRPFLIVTWDPAIKIDLEIGDRAVDLLAKGDAIELIEHRLVEALDDAVIRYEIRRRLCARLFPKGRRRYGGPIWDTGRREHEGAGRPSIDSGPRARARTWPPLATFPDASADK